MGILYNCIDTAVISDCGQWVEMVSVLTQCGIGCVVGIYRSSRCNSVGITVKSDRSNGS